MTQYSYKYNEQTDAILLYSEDCYVGFIDNGREFYPNNTLALSSSDIAEIHNIQLNFLFIKRYLLENEKA